MPQAAFHHAPGSAYLGGVFGGQLAVVDAGAPAPRRSVWSCLVEEAFCQLESIARLVRDGHGLGPPIELPGLRRRVPPSPNVASGSLLAVYHPDGTSRTLRGDDLLSGEDVFPGFTVRMRDLLR